MSSGVGMNASKTLWQAFVVLLVALLSASPCTVMAQIDYSEEFPESHVLTRGRFWFDTYGMSAAGDGKYNTAFSYPGYFGAQDLYTAWWNGKPIAAFWEIDGFEVSGKISNYNEVDEYTSVIEQNTLHENYNFVGEGGISEAEEYTTNRYIYHRMHHKQSGERMGLIEVKTKTRVWSVPKYDDFYIEEVTIVNRDSFPVYNFRWAYPLNMQWGLGQYNNDKEYYWDPEREIFIFYDDTSFPVDETSPIVYQIPPGDVTGDAGDPGNITEVNSIDRKLYAPQAIAMKVLNMPPNKNGEQKVWHTIKRGGGGNSGAGVPDREYVETITNEYQTYVEQIQVEQEKASWRDLWNDPTRPKDGSVDGNLYERRPWYAAHIGPYDLEIGESISWTFVMVGGEMDRDVTMLGGLKATEHFQEAAIEAVKENLDAAIELIDNNYVLPPDAYPPPTVGLPPFVGSDNEVLKVEPFAESVDGEPIQGFDISWLAVPDDYTNPATGEADFAGYKLYRSEIDVTGPWNEIADISKEEAGQFQQGNRIVYRVETETGVPYRFAATSYSTHGLESGMTAYSYYSESAPIAPRNDMSLIKVVPNPFRQRSGLLDPGQNDRIAFVNIPAHSTIRIYTLAGDLVKEVNHDGFGESAWGSSQEQNFMLTEFRQNVMPGLYIYHVENRTPGHEGETHIGKFMVIR